MSEDYKLAHLREALAGGSAADLIADVLDGPGAYTAIMEELDRWFGGKDRNLEQQERELMAWPRITNRERPGNNEAVCRETAKHVAQHESGQHHSRP